MKRLNMDKQDAWDGEKSKALSCSSMFISGSGAARTGFRGDAIVEGDAAGAMRQYATRRNRFAVFICKAPHRNEEDSPLSHGGHGEGNTARTKGGRDIAEWAMKNGKLKLNSSVTYSVLSVPSVVSPHFSAPPMQHGMQQNLACCMKRRASQKRKCSGSRKMGWSYMGAHASNATK
jgi:hypothetical protein